MREKQTEGINMTIKRIESGVPDQSLLKPVVANQRAKLTVHNREAIISETVKPDGEILICQTSLFIFYQSLDNGTRDCSPH